MHRLLVASAAALSIVATGACSRTPQPMVEAVKPMQESLDKAKGVEQTLQQAHESQQRQIDKE